MRETDSKHGCIARMPAKISYEEATAAAYGGLLALQFTGDRRHRARTEGARLRRVGYLGDDGGAVREALGAEVTGVCSTAHMELVRSLGADTCSTTRRRTPSSPATLRLRARRGRPIEDLELKESAGRASPGRKYVSIDDGALKLVSARLERIRELLEAGHVKPVMDRCFPFAELVEAHRYVGQGHKAGEWPSQSDERPGRPPSAGVSRRRRS